MSNKKAFSVNMTCTEEEIQRIREAAEASHMSLSMFILHASLGDADIVLTKKKS